MDSQDGPGRAGSLVVELAARTVIVDGTRVELPPTEFSLLAVLAARPGEIVAHKKLLEEALGDGDYMDTQELHWRIWNIRKLIGDTDKTIIRNRRGVGFVLEAQRVEVLEGVAEKAVDAPAHVIRLEPDESPEATDPGPAIDGTQERTRRSFMVLSPAALLVITLIAGLVLAGSWLAGYMLSQRDEPAAAAAPPPTGGSADRPKQADGSRSKHVRSQPKKDQEAESKGGARSYAVGTTGEAASDPAQSSTEPTAQSRTEQRSQPQEGGNTQTQTAPQPDAQLYHLFNPDSGDHFMTTSSSVANQKEAAGYSATVEGGVFTSQEKGTTAISLDSGTVYVYRESGSAPNGLTLATLYKLSLDGDFFYTASSSTANQAQAEGWTRATVGYVTT